MSQTYRVQLQQSGDSFACAADDTLLRAGLRAGQGMAYECNVGSCGSCKFDLIEGEVETLWEDAPGLNPRDKKRGRQLGCQSIPKSDCVIKTMVNEYYAPRDLPRRFDAVLTEIRDLTHDIREFRFTDAGGAAFRPGQYALFNLDGVEGGRAYSMSNTGNGDGHWEFIIRKVPGGAGTTALFDRVKVGDTVNLDGPYGLAYLRTDIDRQIICISGGSGLAPALSIARGLVEEPAMSGVNLKFFYGARGPEDLCGEEELKALPGFGERLQFYPALSEAELAKQGNWNGYVGFIHEMVKATVSEEELQNAEFYTCGPPPMINAVMQTLAAEAGVPPDRIHYDSFF